MNGETSNSPESPAELTEREKVLVGVWENMALDYLIKEKPHNPSIPEDLVSMMQAIANQYALPIDAVQEYEGIIREQMAQASSHFAQQQ